MSLLIKSPALVPGYTSIAALKYLTFGRLFLNAEQRSYQGKTDGTEVALDVFSGRCRVKVKDQVMEAGGRDTAFDGPPSAVYLPPGTDYEVECPDRKSTRLNSSHIQKSRMPSSA